MGELYPFGPPFLGIHVLVAAMTDSLHRYVMMVGIWVLSPWYCLLISSGNNLSVNIIEHILNSDNVGLLMMKIWMVEGHNM